MIIIMMMRVTHNILKEKIGSTLSSLGSGVVQRERGYHGGWEVMIMMMMMMMMIIMMIMIVEDHRNSLQWNIWHRQGLYYKKNMNKLRHFKQNLHIFLLILIAKYLFLESGDQQRSMIVVLCQIIRIFNSAGWKLGQWRYFIIWTFQIFSLWRGYVSQVSHH